MAAKKAARTVRLRAPHTYGRTVSASGKKSPWREVEQDGPHMRPRVIEYGMESQTFVCRCGIHHRWTDLGRLSLGHLVVCGCGRVHYKLNVRGQQLMSELRKTV